MTRLDPSRDVARPVIDVLLRDGRIAQVRPVSPEDEGTLRQLNSRLSPRTRLSRYFSEFEPIGDRYVEHVLQSVREQNSLVVEVAGETVAVGSFFRLAADPGLADVALLIDDRHQGLGIGTLLLEHLAARARQQGIGSLVADVLSDNRSMLELFATSGLSSRMSTSLGVTQVELSLDPAGDVWDVVAAREGAAQRASLLPALAPRSLAVVGSGRPGSIARQVLASVERGGFSGRVYAVGHHPGTTHPARVSDIATAVDGPLDLVVVAVPAEQVLGVATDCAVVGARALLVLSAGFAEVGDEGRVRQRDLLALCRENDMRLIGPNCLGVINSDPAVLLSATFCDARPRPGGLALISQSGAVGVAALRHAETAGAGLSLFVSTGNKADVSGNDLLAYVEHDPRTRVIALYLESFGNARTFARVAARVGRAKPIVVVKAGRSVAGGRAGASHTAAAATPDVAVDALFQQAGVVRADDLPELFDISGVLDRAPRPRGRRVAIVGNSGGPGVLAADACESSGLQVLPLSGATRAALRQLLPAAAAVDNPVDVLATATPVDYQRAVSIVLADPDVDAVIAIYTPLIRGSEAAYAAVLRDCAEAAPGTALLASFPGVSQPPAQLRRPDGELALPCFEFPEFAARALGKVVAYTCWRDRKPLRPPLLADLDRAGARALVDRGMNEVGPDGWMSNETASAVLGCYGIPVLASRQVTDVTAAIEAGRELGTVVLKASGPGLVHKSDVGGVRLDLARPEDVGAAFLDMRSRLGSAMTSATVQQMVREPDGVELALGLVVDKTVGPLIMVGAGGIFADILADRALRILPLDVERAREQVLSLRCAPMLTGARGRLPLHLEAVTDALVRLAALASDLPEVAELDINPFVVGQHGGVGLDVKLRLLARAPDPALPVRSLRSPGRTAAPRPG